MHRVPVMSQGSQQAIFIHLDYIDLKGSIMQTRLSVKFTPGSRFENQLKTHNDIMAEWSLLTTSF